MIKILKDLKLYLKPKILSIFFLGISSGLPLALTLSTLFVWLTEEGISKSTIGFFVYAGMCYSLKFLWAPIFDNIKLPILYKALGRRRSWMIVVQSLLIIAIFSLGLFDPSTNIVITFLLAMIIAFLSASQDIVIDAYRIDILETEELGAGAFMANFGYRIGMLLTNAGALFLASFYSWSTVYAVSASCIIIGVITTLLVKEPEFREKKTDKNLSIIDRVKISVFAPFKDFIRRPNWALILLFVMFFKLGDALAGTMTNPFLLEQGYSKIEIASIVKTFGLFATLAGSFVGGIMMYRIGMIKGLWIAGILQMVTNLAFLILCYYGYNPMLLAVVMSIENFAGGIGSVALVAYLGSLCNVEFSATQYALLSSVASLGRTFLSGTSGILVDQFGWSNFFIISTIAALPGLVFLYCLAGKLTKLEVKVEVYKSA